MAKSSPQANEFDLITGALGYRSRSDFTATPKGYLVSGSQNVLINEATDKAGDKVETRAGYELFGAANTDRNKILSEFVFKTKAGNSIMLRSDNNGDLEYYSEQTDAWETLYTGLSTTYPVRFTTAHNPSELLRVLLFVNHSAIIYEWSGAVGTLPSDASVTAGTITINEVIATAGFLTAGTRSIRIKDSGGTWRETVYTGQSGSDFTVSSDLSAFTFNANAPVVQVVRVNSSEPAAGVINDTIKTLQNHVFVGSHSSSVVYMSKSTDYLDFSFSSPRIPTEGWQFVLDDFNVGFDTNIAGGGEESLVMFAGNDWIYRVQFEQLGDAAVLETLKVKPILVSPGQGATSQELIFKVGNSIIFLNTQKELVEVGQFENFNSLQQVPISDPIKPDFIDADFTGGSIRFWKNNLYVTAPVSSKTFILSFREGENGVRRFWQPPQVLPIGQMSVYAGDLIGHSGYLTESYKMFTGTNDNEMPIAFKAHFSYNNNGAREKLKNFGLYFTEMYLTSNTVVTHKIIYEYLGSKSIVEYTYTGTDTANLFNPNAAASLGVNSLGTSSLGSGLFEPTDFIKFRKFKKVRPVDYFECQIRYESDEIDAQFQILAHGSNAGLSRTAPANITN